MKKIILAALVILLSACVYRIDIQEGNILAQKDIDKLRPGLTKNQVIYVLGKPVVDDAFADNTWHYLYVYKSGKDGKVTRKDLVLTFQDDKLVQVAGDYDLPPAFQPNKGDDAQPEQTNQTDN